MSGEWREVQLGSIAERITKGTTPTTIGEGFISGGVRFLKVESLSSDGRILPGKVAYIDRDTHDKLSRSQLKRDDILYTIAGTIGRVAIVPEGIVPANTNQAVGIVRLKPDLALPRFVYYALREQKRINQARSRIVQSVQANFSLAELSSIVIPLPPLPEQRRIAKILGDLDDKIELNRKMNETLEQMARALFKSWFIDFDPVRAKMEGRQPPGMDADTAALFPSRLVESELGLIPEGWEVAEMDSIAETIDCLHSKKPEQVEHGFPMLQLNNIRNDGLVDLTDCYLISEQDYSKWTSRMEATSGDCVITNVGRVGAVAKIPDDMRAALGRNMTGIRCRASFQYPTFLIECLLSSAMREEIARKVDTGTILDALNVKSIPRLRFIRSTNDIVDRFEMIVLPIRKTMEKNLSQSRTLASLRDTLLPQLMRGEGGGVNSL